MSEIEMQTQMINLYSCLHPLMIDKVEMQTFLDKLVNFIGMRKISEEFLETKNPVCFFFDPNDLPETEYGVTGTLIMCESHISAHSFPEKSGFLNIVITSCKSFDEHSVLLWVLEYTNSFIYKTRTIKF